MLYEQYVKSTEDRLDQELRHEIWCKRNQGNHGRDIHITTAINIFKEELPVICYEHIKTNDNVKHWEGILETLRDKEKLEFNEKIQKAKDFPIDELARNLGYEINQNFIQSPFLEPQRTGSCKIYPNTNSWYDFASGKGGDTIDLVKQTLNTDFINAINYLI